MRTLRNILLWRMPRRRLEVEAIRDGIMICRSVDIRPTAARSFRIKIASMWPTQSGEAVSISTSRSVRCTCRWCAVQCTNIFQGLQPSGSQLYSQRQPQLLPWLRTAPLMIDGSVMLEQSKKMANKI